ncbi:lipase secretion chaperone [Acinetobacter larvae]|uniref:Lipase chaperone n=1 Tax=Acinetobacter larvae TaxID=1789224 RepID=A0A1B2LW34_9GAMM|nr:lipase secretion chaperone [Acinetobacter larvae]AOA57150.1 lipase chaperone [Acinetobacter larvae]
MSKSNIYFAILCAILLVAILFYVIPSTSKSLPGESATQAQQLQQHAASESLSTATLDPENLKSLSQQDTQIDCQLQLTAQGHLRVNEHTRNCFEYFISQYGEKELAHIQKAFIRYIEQHYQAPAAAQIIDLWQRYLKYRQESVDLQSSNTTALEETAAITAYFEKVHALRKNYFNATEIQGLFGEEDLYNNYTLQRMAILEDSTLSAAQKAQQLKKRFEALPQEWQENLKQLTQLDDLNRLTQQIKSQSGSAQQLRAMRNALVGTEATVRLEQLDQQRQQWKQQVLGFLNEKDKILQSNLNDASKKQAIQSLRDQSFADAKQQSRLKTFEDIHQQGGQLPFID